MKSVFHEFNLHNFFTERAERFVDHYVKKGLHAKWGMCLDMLASLDL